MLCWPSASWAFEPDVFGTESSVAETATRNMLGAVPCRMGELPEQLTLEEVIERALCADPKTRQAWASAKVQAAQVGVSQSAYLPRLDGSAGVGSKRSNLDYDNDDLSRDDTQHQKQASLNLSWTLLDFGRRGAALRNARELLVAANANQDAVLQDSFVRVADNYYQALAAQRSLAASVQVAQMADENLRAADAKFKAGAAALSDQLQAQTAFSKARLSQERKAGALRNALGSLALLMGFAPETPLALADNLKVLPDVHFVTAVDDLLEQARKDHPSLLAARARLHAAEAALDQSRAEGRPTLSLTAGLATSQLGQPDYPNGGDMRQRDKSIGLELKIPLFEGFERTYRTRGALAGVERSQAEIADAEQQLSLEVWASYQALSVETQSLRRTSELVEQSRQTLEVIQGRYHSGVGSMLELLSALSAFADAEDQDIQSLSNWQSARLKLASSLGRLGVWAVKTP
ncbi:TolC family protein [Pseudomonas yamanorum]|uniref:TolC family protein n=1 Tax=Pseudomonas yamanorum TaxID=515393 RepID=UPI002ED3C0B5|nr:TolC family protein [Pseudomonas yamanorum]